MRIFIINKKKEEEGLSFEILGVDLYHILSWFIVYSFMGWIWESCYVSAKSKKWVNRGFVSGPFVTIYGVGAVTVYVILRPVAGTSWNSILQGWQSLRFWNM